MTGGAWVHLHWLPLGAGGSALVRLSGRTYERVVARRAHRSPRAILHTALEVCLEGQAWTVEVAPVWIGTAPESSSVAQGAVGSRLLGVSRLFRYEVRCWRDGVIPDAAYAVGGPVDVPTDPSRVADLLELVRAVPTPVWGRDELGAGEMWNSNSVVAWLLVGSGHDVMTLRPPTGGRAPGWDAGLRLAPTPPLHEVRV